MTVLVLSGPIGAGKSSLTSMLAHHLHTQPFFESVEDNPVLPLFYDNPNQYAFLLQIYFLNTRFASIKAALANDNNVLDRSIYEDALFFQMNADMGRATQVEVETYRSLLANMMEELKGMPKKNPDLLIHIDVSYDTMLRRIKKRGRKYEQVEAHPDLVEYYQRLLTYYGPWYENYQASPKMRIDGDRYDFVGNTEDRHVVMNQITTKLAEIRQN